MRGDLEYLDRWSDLSPAGVLMAVAEYERFAAEARALNTESLTDEVLVATVAASATSDALGRASYAELTGPNMQMGLVSWLLPGLSVQPLVTAEHGRLYLKKIERFGDFAGQLIDRLREGVESDRVPLARHAADTAAKLSELIGDPGEPFAQQAPPTDLDSQGAASWTRDLADHVARYLKPAVPAGHRRACCDHAAGRSPRFAPGTHASRRGNRAVPAPGEGPHHA